MVDPLSLSEVAEESRDSDSERVMTMEGMGERIERLKIRIFLP